LITATIGARKGFGLAEIAQPRTSVGASQSRAAFNLKVFKGALVSCAQLGIVEHLTARPVNMLDLSRDYSHLLSNRRRRRN